MSEKQALINCVVDKNTKREFSLTGVPLVLNKRDFSSDDGKKKTNGEAACRK